MYKRDDLPKNFCPVPFSNLICHADGEVSVCRLLEKDVSVGNINENTIEEIWNSDKAKKWRREFLSGDIKICQKNIKHSGCNKQNDHFLKNLELSEIQSKPMKSFTANLNGECNLTCPMCKVWKMPNGLYNGKNLDYLIDEVFPGLEIIDFYSGEPLIQEDTFKFMEALPKVNPDCLWHFTTNAQWKLTQEMKDRFNKIKIEVVNVSLDSFEENTYARIRRKGKIQDAEKTIREMIHFFNSEYKFRNELKNIVEISITIQKENAWEVPSFVKKAESLGCRPLVQVLHAPTGLSIFRWTNDEKVKLLDHYLKNLSRRGLHESFELISHILESFEGKEKKSYIFKFLTKMDSYKQEVQG